MAEKLIIPTTAGIQIFVGEKVLGVVQSYKVLATKESRPVLAFGQQTPVATIGGAEKYVLELSRIYATDDGTDDRIDFFEQKDFRVVVQKGNKSVCYDGCNWDRLEEGAEVGSPVLERAVLTAATRTVVGKNNEQ